MLLICDLKSDAVVELLEGYGLTIEWIPEQQTIHGTFWGEPEAGVVGNRMFARPDTPVHSLLHETCHFVCMTPDRRTELKGHAGGDDLEESSVCYLQIVLADELPGVCKERLMQDMDDWGYSFRLGSASRWFEQDADDARAWLIKHGLIEADNRPSYQLRRY